MQPSALFALAEFSKSIGLSTGLHTNGVYPDVLRKLIEGRLIEHIALDIKAEWNLYTVRGKERAVGKQVKESLTLCTAACHAGTLPGFEVVVTLFPGYGEEVMTISHDVAPDIDIVLQQGVYMGIRPLDLNNLKGIADRLGRTVRIRTRSDGEITYEGTCSSGDAGIRER